MTKAKLQWTDKSPQAFNLWRGWDYSRKSLKDTVFDTTGRGNFIPLTQLFPDEQNVNNETHCFVIILKNIYEPLWVAMKCNEIPSSVYITEICETEDRNTQLQQQYGFGSRLHKYTCDSQH